MSGIEPFTVDTNILFYAVDPSDRRHSAALDFLLKAPFAGGLLGSQALGEFFHATTRKVALTWTQARDQVLGWAETFSIFTPIVEDIGVAIQTVESHNFSYWDAHLLASAHRVGCKLLFSEDMQDGFMFGDLRIVNPFEPRNEDAIAPILAARED